MEIELEYRHLRCQQGSSDKFYCVIDLGTVPGLERQSLTGYGRSNTGGNSWTVGNTRDSRTKLREKQSARKGYETDTPSFEEANAMIMKVENTIKNVAKLDATVRLDVKKGRMYVELEDTTVLPPIPVITPSDMSWAGDW